MMVSGNLKATLDIRDAQLSDDTYSHRTRLASGTQAKRAVEASFAPATFCVRGTSLSKRFEC